MTILSVQSLDGKTTYDVNKIHDNRDTWGYHSDMGYYFFVRFDSPTVIKYQIQTAGKCKTYEHLIREINQIPKFPPEKKSVYENDNYVPGVVGNPFSVLNPEYVKIYEQSLGPRISLAQDTKWTIEEYRLRFKDPKLEWENYVSEKTEVMDEAALDALMNEEPKPEEKKTQ